MSGNQALDTWSLLQVSQYLYGLKNLLFIAVTEAFELMACIRNLFIQFRTQFYVWLKFALEKWILINSSVIKVL
jgi:hypothetical protein